tara:strand:- start:253 stop:486 length:234 start_codon:yes stop_codon:yes gene_type:complete
MLWGRKMAAPYAYTISQTAQVSALSRSEIYRAINRGDLIARKRGKRTLILAQDLQRWLDSLPVIENPKPSGSARRRV